MKVKIRKMYDTAKRNVWMFEDSKGNFLNPQGNICRMPYGFRTRAEAIIVAKQHLRNKKFTHVRYEYIGKDADGVRQFLTKELKL